MNTNYGKIQHDKLVYAPDSLTIDNMSVMNPTGPVYQREGWYLIKIIHPKLKSTQKEVLDHYKLDHIGKILYIVNKAENDSKAARKISKVYLKIALAKIGKLNTFNDWLKSVEIDLGGGNSINAYDAFESCLVVDEGDPLFAPYIKQAKLAFGLTDQQYDDLMEQCIAK